MAATHLTLDEAAEQLGISPEEFKKRLKTDPAFKTLVPIRDGSNLRFKSTAIEELARQLGAASNPELPLAPLEAVTPDSDDFKVPGTASKKDGKPAADEPLEFSSPLESSPIDDIFTLAPESGEKDKNKNKDKKGGKGESDSDVRLEAGKKPRRSMDDSDESHVPTEELSIDFNGPGSAVIKGGSSSKLSAPKSSSKMPKSDSGKSLANTGASDSSEFELSLDADSDDFELKLNTDASDEVDLGELPKDTSGSGRRGGESGINLRSPADSGISLEKGKTKEPDAKKPEPAEGSDVDFELTLDSSAAASSLRLSGLKKGSEPESDSEFELTLDDSSDSGLEMAGSESAEAEKRDIFETDFEIPPMDESGSEAVALETDTDVEKSDSDVLEEASDSDVVEEDSGSEAVLLEDEAEAPAPAARKKPAARKAADVEEADGADVDLADVDLADEDGAAGALKGVKGRRGDEDEEEEGEAVAAGAGAYRPIPWGPIPALFLFPALVVTLVGGLMGYELLQTMWGYQQPRKPAAPLVRAVADNLGIEMKDQ